MNETSFIIDSSEGPYNTGKKYENGNMGHRPGIKGGYFPVPPVDSAQDMRGEYLKALRDMGVKVEKHHHEVAPSQHELGMYFGTLTNQADNVLQLYKYAVQMVTHSFGKTATFMPKPVKEIMVLGCTVTSLFGKETLSFYGKRVCWFVKRSTILHRWNFKTC